MTATERDWQRTLDLTYQHMATKQQVTSEINSLENRLIARMARIESRLDTLEQKLDWIVERLS